MAAGIHVDGVSGHIDLTSSLYSQLYAANTDHIIVFVDFPVWNPSFGAGRVWSAEGNGAGANPRLSIESADGSTNLVWTGVDPFNNRMDKLASSGQLYSFMTDFTAGAAGTLNFRVADSPIITDAIDTLVAPDVAGMRLGNDRDGGSGQYVEGTYGFFAILNIGTITPSTTKLAWYEEFTNMLNNLDQYNWNPDAMRAAIMSYDPSISGDFWKLDEAGTSGSADSLALVKYNIADGLSLPVGTDLVTNGDFETGDFTGWGENTVPGTSIVGNACKFTYDVASPNIFLGQSMATEVGKTYGFSYEVKANSGVSINELVFSSTSAFGAVTGLPVDIGNHTVNLLAIADTTFDFRLAVTSIEPGDTITIDNIVITEIGGLTSPAGCDGARISGPDVNDSRFRTQNRFDGNRMGAKRFRNNNRFPVS